MSDAAEAHIIQGTYNAPESKKHGLSAVVGPGEHHLGGARQEDDGLLPHNAPVAVLHVVHLVEDDPRQLAQQLRAPAGADETETSLWCGLRLSRATSQQDRRRHRAVLAMHCSRRRRPSYMMHCTAFCRPRG